MNYDQHRVQRIVLRLIEDLEIARGFDDEEDIQRATRLVSDLGYTQVHFSALARLLSEQFGPEGNGLERLFCREGRFAEDVTAGDVVKFIWKRLSRTRRQAASPASQTVDNVIWFPRAHRRSGYHLAHV